MAVDSQALARVLEAEPLPCCRIARQLGKRKADVLATLVAEPERFERSGRGRGSKWRLRTTPDEHSVAELCRRADAVRKLIAAGVVQPLDGLGLLVWPQHELLLPGTGDERQAA